MKIKDYFQQGLLSKKIDFFPYPERFCPFCERTLECVDAIHISREQEHYKALYMCMNDQCGAFDMEAKKAYARIYFSSEEAYRILQGKLIYTDKRKQV